MKGILAMMNGNTYLCKEVTVLINNKLKRWIRLSRSESKMLGLIAEGFTNQEISDTLFLSSLTMETQRENLLDKLEARNALSIIKIVIENKLI